MSLLRLWLAAMLLASPALSMWSQAATAAATPQKSASAASAAEDEEDAELEDAEGDVFIEGTYTEETVESWEQDSREKIAVDDKVVNKQWAHVPFDKRYFDYTPEQMKARWPQLMRALQVPYPSPDYLRARIEKYPQLKDELGPNFSGDYNKLSADILNAWRLFFRGDFRASKDAGKNLGAFGKMPGYLSQIIYAMYLSDTVTEKQQLLQDVVNQTANYQDILRDLKDQPDFREDYIVMRLGYAYAIGRIAEEVPPPVAIARNYLFRVNGAIKDIFDVNPDHPIALAFRAGMDAQLIRVMGKAAGRLTFGARESRAEEYFGEAFKQLDDVAIVHYEYANCLIYMNRKREISEALDHFRKAQSIQPISAMEALDSMYAAKRYREIDDFLKYGRSFRSYERKRRGYMKDTDQNLHNVLRPPWLITEYLAQR